jgi:hypothetical protein
LFRSDKLMKSPTGFWFCRARLQPLSDFALSRFRGSAAVWEQDGAEMPATTNESGPAADVKASWPRFRMDRFLSRILSLYGVETMN